MTAGAQLAMGLEDDTERVDVDAVAPATEIHHHRVDLRVDRPGACPLCKANTGDECHPACEGARLTANPTTPPRLP